MILFFILCFIVWPWLVSDVDTITVPKLPRLTWQEFVFGIVVAIPFVILLANVVTVRHN